MGYPSEEQIRKKLLPFRALLWLSVPLLLGGGGYLEIQLGIVDAFSKSGGFLVATAVFAYFLLERKDYFTGRPQEFVGSSGHALPKKIMALTEASMVVVGTLVATFGDWFIKTVSEA